MPNGPVLSPGIAQFATTYEDPSTLDATAIRVDHTMGNFTLFGRYNHAPSRGTRALVLAQHDHREQLLERQLHRRD